MENKKNKFSYISSKAAREFLENNGYLYEQELSDITVPNEILGLINQDLIAKYQLLPFRIEKNMLYIFTTFENMAIKMDIKRDVQKALKTKGQNLNIDLIYTESNLRTLIRSNYNLNFDTTKKSTTNIDNKDIPAVRMKVMNMINTAIDRDVSDIHILPTEGRVIVEFRIKGKLIDVSSEFKFPEEQRRTVANIAKILDTSGQIDQSNSLVEGNGSFEYAYQGTIVNIRISTIPTAQGFESIALRLLVRRNDKRRLDDLGYNKTDINIIRAINKACANGLILIAGPTGAGKSTLNYALVYDDVEHAMNNYNEMKYVETIENPVEIFEPTFCQVQERLTPDNPKLNFPPERIMEAFLRHDPDIIIYGEIRSKVDADVATKSGQTGHKVYATVHANDCVTTILRLLDLDISRVSLLEQIRIIMSQRLIKILCPTCSKEYHLTEQDKILLTPKEYETLSCCNLKTIGDADKVSQCPDCDGTGYLKRLPILEYIVFNDELRDLFMDTDVKYTVITKVLQKYKFENMWDKTFGLIKSGQVDLGEAIGTVGNKIAINNIINNIYKKEV